MSHRNEHLFQFSAADITRAAGRLADYHEERERYWRDTQEEAAQRVMADARIELQRHAITGGERLSVGVCFGNPGDHQRMQEAFGKAQTHRDQAAEYRTHERVYGSQAQRMYDLDPADVHHFRLGEDLRKPVEAS